MRNEQVLLLAADLAGTRMDPNEAQKALAYLRSVKEPKEYFDYLRAINQHGGAVIRSGQTLNYYRELLVASERHLRGMSLADMQRTLGWALRLLRYYRTVPDAAGIIAEVEQSPTPIQQTTPTKAALQIPNAGDVVRLEIVEADESVAILKIPEFDIEQVTGVIREAQLARKRYKVGNVAWVKVLNVRTLKNGRTIVELEPTKRPE